MMDTNKKEALTRLTMSDKESAAIRAKAARYFTGLSQEQLGKRIGVSKASVSNTEKGMSFPGRDMLLFFHRECRIDFNFMMVGQFSQLPSDVQDDLFPALERANSEWDQTPNSD